jgi:hypothetical protein
MRSALVVALVLAGCSRVREVRGTVAISPDRQADYSDELRGEVMVTDHDLSYFSTTTIGILCEPTAEDIVFSWGSGAPGCAVPVDIEVWIRSTEFPFPCGEMFTNTDGEPELGEPVLIYEAFADHDPAKCESGLDVFELRFE